MNASDQSPPPIRPEEVAAVADRMVPLALPHLDEDPIARETCTNYLPALTLLLGQYGDRHSRYHGNEEMLALAWREIEHELGRPQPRFPAYDTLFVIWELFDCFRAAEGVLSPRQLGRLRALFRPLGELLLDNPWDFESDDRINPALLRSTALGVCGWALDDDRMRRESRDQAEAIFARCDENDVPSEVSISYCAHMAHWISQACEVEHRPDLLRLMAGMCRIIPMLVYEPTLELMGPDCRDQWKTPGRHTLDTLVVGLRAAAVLLSDGSSEWLSRALFRRWLRDAEPDSSVYTARSPRYIGVERYEMGWGHLLGADGYDPNYGAADAPKLVTATAMRTGQLMCALKRWLGPDVAATKPVVSEEYRSSRLYLRRYRNGADVAALANTIQPLSYMTPGFGLQGIELWTDDRFFWFNLAGFHPTAFCEHGFTVLQAPHPEAVLRKTQGPASDRIIHGAAKCGDHLLSLTRIDCSQELVPGIVSWAGLLLVSDREGEVIFGRGQEIGRGRVLEEQNDCDWILYPCDADRRFGFGILALSTTGNSNRLSNFSGDWCVLGLSDSAEPIQGLSAFAVLAIGPWEGSPESYAEWLRAWQAEQPPDRCVLVAPEGKRLEVPYPPAPMRPVVSERPARLHLGGANMSISLRAAALEDYPAINDLEATLADRETDRRASFDAVLADPDHDLIVAEADGAVVGLAHLMTYHDLSHGALAGQVLGLVVQEDHRGRGIGRALLNDLCRIATRRGIVEFHINTEPDNAIAQRLYRSIGAEVIGVQMEIELPCDRE